MKFITNIIGNLGVNIKLGLIMGLPLIGMLVLSAMLGGSDWDQLHRLALLEKSVNLNVKIGIWYMRCSRNAVPAPALSIVKALNLVAF